MTISLQTEDQKRLLQWALGYAKLGWPVLPLHDLILDLNGPPGDVSESILCSCAKGAACPPRNRGKHPRISRWEEQASTDPAQIRAWWGKWPVANIGVACGKAGYLVLDLDAYKSEYGGAGLSAAERQTITCQTGGGGLHLWYRMRPEDTFGNSAEGLPPGIDIRAHGGMVVVPPSLHPSGRRYEWKMGLGPGQVEARPIPASVRSILEARDSHEARLSKQYTGRRYSLAELEEAMTAAGWTFSRRDRLDKLGRISYDLGRLPPQQGGT